MIPIFNNFTLLSGITILLALVPIIINVPSIEWSIIDDAYFYQVYLNFYNSLIKLDPIGLWNVFSEGDGSRFRPFFNIYISLTYILLGNNALIHHVVRLLIYVIVSFFFFKYLYRLSKSLLWSLFFGYLFIISPFVIENVVRLGPVEFIALFLFMTLIAYFVRYLQFRLKKKDLALVWVLLVALFFTKEIYVVMIIPLFIAISIHKLLNFRDNFNYKLFLDPLIFFMSLGLFYVVAYLLNKDLISNWLEGSEISNYKLSFNQIMVNLRGLTSMLWQHSRFEVSIFGVSIVFLASAFFNGKLRFELLKDKHLSALITSLFMFLFLFLIQVPWLYVLERYLILIQFFLIITSFLSLTLLINLFRNNLASNNFRWGYIFMWIAIIYFVYPQVLKSNIYNYNYSSWYAGFTQFEDEYTDALVEVYEKYHHPIVYNFKDNVSNVEVFKNTNNYLALKGENTISDLQYLESLCNSKSENSSHYIVVDRPGDLYTNLSSKRHLISGEKYIYQINKDPIIYNWEIYDLSKEDACR